MEQKTTTIQRPVVCKNCGFSTKYGDEMRSHYQAKHDLVWSGMQYLYSWAVGRANTYSWLHSHSLELDTSSLRICGQCSKPYVAYESRDECDECMKLPEVQAYLKYSYNRAGYEHVNHYTMICKKCGLKTNDISEQRSHGELKKVDGVLQHVCTIPN